MYLVALSKKPLAERTRRFQGCSIQRQKLGSRFLTVVSDGQFSTFAKQGDEYRLCDMIAPITTSPPGLVRSEVTVPKHGEAIRISMSSVRGATVYYVADTNGVFYCATRISLLRDAGVPITENREVLPELFC